MLDVAPPQPRPLKYKPRKVSAVRDFPPGCGRHAPLLNPKPLQVLKPDPPPSNGEISSANLESVPKNEPAELAALPEPPRLGNGEVVNGLALVEVAGSDAIQPKEEEERGEAVKGVNSIADKLEPPIVGGAVRMTVYSKNYPPPKRRKVWAVRDFPEGCGRNAPCVDGRIVETSSESKSEYPEKKPVERPKPVAESSVGIESTGQVAGVATSNDSEQGLEKSQDCIAGALVKFHLKGISNGSSTEESSERKVFEAEATRNDVEKVKKKIEETGREVRVRPVLKTSSSLNLTEVRSEKKALVRSVSEKKLEGRDMKQVSKDLQVVLVNESKPSRPDARPKSASKVVEQENKCVTGRAINKEPVKSLKDNTNLKRKFSEESEVNERAIVVRAQEDESLEEYSDRLIVQALMSAQNCPWRQGKKSRAIRTQSATPKNKVKREGKLPSMNVSPIESSASRHKRKVEAVDEEDGVPQAEDNTKVRDVYRRLCEMQVNLTPFGPSTSSQEDGDSDGRVTRNKVKKALRLFHVMCRKLLQGEEDKSKGFGKIHRVDLTVAGILKENKQWVNTGKPILGSVPGVEVGDEFHYRVEISIVGLHRPFQGGIDYTKLDGMIVATSIVASGGYPDDVDSSDVLIYSGSGGNPGKGKQADDQKLERGNLALKNSITTKTPVRVIYGFKEMQINDSNDSRGKYLSTFTYDGLYLVEKYWSETGPRGFSVFKFQLRRILGQPELALREVKKSKKSRVREGQCINDISERKEKIPICAVNKIDDERPTPFKYTTRMIYPSWFVCTPPAGCDCVGGCSDSAKCACAVKNGGEIPFNFNGSIVQAKPLVYECGPSCKCPPSCHNRVSQHGIKIKLEIFKTTSRGWGVRSLSSIPSGSFICEYIGELIEDTEAELRSNDEYLFDIGHNYDDHSLWEGLPSIPGLQSSSLIGATEEVGFTIDAAEYGNVGRFINHSCSPNLYAQNVLYDHDDKRIPHVMFFAADNIPPLQELTYHYNYTIDQVRDSEGNIKRKSCHCGSPECTGRLY